MLRNFVLPLGFSFLGAWRQNVRVEDVGIKDDYLQYLKIRKSNNVFTFRMF